MKLANYNIFKYEVIDSTNEEAKRLFHAGIKENSLILANMQTQGKGRNNREWFSPAGNLYLSLLSVAKYNFDIAAQLAFVSAVSFGEALANYHVHNIQYKWPNDILIENRKLAGILLEAITVADQSQIEALIIGIGCNLTSIPQDIPYPATYLQEHNYNVPIDSLMHDFVEAFEKNKNLLYFEGFSIISHKWLKKAYGIGQPAKIVTLKQNVSGIFEGIDEKGQLKLRLANNELLVINCGEVFFT